jgi:hypothetical protein
VLLVIKFVLVLVVLTLVAFRVVQSIVPVVILSPSIVDPPESKLTIPFIDLI